MALEWSSQSAGNEKSQTFKSKRGGNVEVTVKKKVSWPHEPILGGAQRQRITYDQLSLTQWVQAFCKNLLEEPSTERRDAMVAYMGELMEDATDFSWQGAKAAHAVMLCEMERGKILTASTEYVELTRKSISVIQSQIGQNWVKITKKPWFCKQFQHGLCSHSKDHDTNGRTHKHICAFCLSNEKQLGHGEKDCTQKKAIAKKRYNGCSPVGCSSQEGLTLSAKDCVKKYDSNHCKVEKCENSGAPAMGDDKTYRIRFFYNSNVVPDKVDALLAKKHVVKQNAGKT